MWKVKYFKDTETASQWMKDNAYRYQTTLVLINKKHENSYGCYVEYKKLRRIY